MKVLTLLPKKIKETYQIIKQDNCLEVHSPSYVNINFDDSFSIDSNATTCHIVNSKTCVTLWVNTKSLHVTIFE